MATIHDVPVNELVEALAEELKKMPEMTPPEWASFVKTGVHKERPPAETDWWYMRLAAVLRTVAIRGPVGVNKIRAKYGGKKNRGVKPSKTFKGSGSIARKVLQQLQVANLVKVDQKNVHKGRVVTPEGIALLNKASGIVYKPAVKETKAPAKEAPKAKETPKQEAPKAKPKVEAPKEVKTDAKPKVTEAPKPEVKAPVEKKAEVLEVKETPKEQEAPKAEVKEEPKVVEETKAKPESAPKPEVPKEAEVKAPESAPAEKAPEPVTEEKKK